MPQKIFSKLKDGNFRRTKISLQKISVVTKEGQTLERYASTLIVRIDGMLPGILNNREINGEIELYKANFTVTNNKIHGLYMA